MTKFVVVDEILDQLEAAKSGVVPGSVTQSVVSGIQNVPTSIVQKNLAAGGSCFTTVPLSPIIKNCCIDKTYLNLEFDCNLKVSAQVTLLSFLAYSLAKKSKDKEVLNEVSTFLSDLNRLPILMQEILNNKDEYKCLADKIYDKDNIFFIGRGIDEALCMEGSLKLKEISYIHSEAYAAGELKHGTISLIEDGTPVFGIVTDKKIADKTISNLKEVKSRGANVIYVTTNSLNKDGDFYDEKVIIPDTNPLLQPLLTILPLQLTAYYVAKNKNCDIDKPKNLAKSVTVE